MIKQLLNTLFVQTQGAYLHLDHGTLVVEVQGEVRLQVPLHHLGGLVLFGNVLISPFLLHRCAEDGRQVVWFTEQGQFRARLVGPTSGNVLLRRAQHRALDEGGKKLYLARRFVEAKVKNARTVLQRAAREHSPGARLLEATNELRAILKRLGAVSSIDEARGLEGRAAAIYFEVFNELIITDEFGFNDRMKRPPRDPVNALISFLYTLLLNDCVAALEGVGLDPQVGYLHALRPGRPALALDLLEEFRAWWADRLALALLNRRQLSRKHFEARPGGAVYLNESGRRIVIEAYQRRKQDMIRHPLVGDRVPIGLLPHLQARLLARYLRDDLSEYLPFLGK
jgi:CRISPR-associated protein Cas1